MSKNWARSCFATKSSDISTIQPPEKPKRKGKKYVEATQTHAAKQCLAPYVRSLFCSTNYLPTSCRNHGKTTYNKLVSDGNNVSIDRAETTTPTHKIANRRCVYSSRSMKTKSLFHQLDKINDGRGAHGGCSGLTNERTVHTAHRLPHAVARQVVVLDDGNGFFITCPEAVMAIVCFGSIFPRMCVHSGVSSIIEAPAISDSLSHYRTIRPTTAMQTMRQLKHLRMASAIALVGLATDTITIAANHGNACGGRSTNTGPGRTQIPTCAGESQHTSGRNSFAE